ncbi:acyl carrier protein [Pseudomonas frederiksbergensis]|uniref:Acyl carrier protein n=1 Tax=Pseudomonas frederiksbergensis TaxID=104087 RepID=A0A423KMD5_9PSED|nr:acyl carrier protein [Pseudomonas frederiksbergensis]RON55044.1 acyl carrier protein [Pseudomonas frederiksbergensis]
MESVEERIKQITCELLGIEPKDLTNTSSFVEDLKADSLDAVELVMTFEEEFLITIPDEEAVKLTTVQKVIDYIEHQLSL